MVIVDRENYAILEEKFGPEVCQFVHTVEDRRGNIQGSETLSIRKKYMGSPSRKSWDGEEYAARYVVLTLCDKDGKKVAHNGHVELATGNVVSFDTFAKHSKSSSHVRNIPGAGAALIANYIVLKKIPEWRSSSTLTGRTSQDPHTGWHLYSHTLNKHFDHLVYSIWDDRKGAFVVKPI